MKNNNIILLHGALGSKRQFDALAAQLSNHFEVHTLDFEGHGDINSNNEFSISLFSENVLAYLKEMNISKTHIFGYSMGGYVALRLALNNPTYIDQIITLGTKFNWTEEIAAREVKMLNPEKIEEKVPAFAKQLDNVHTANDWKSVMSKTAKMMIDLGSEKKITDEELKSITHQVLVGIGSLDKMVTIEESEHASSILPNGSLNVIEGFKHPIEKVDMAFLAKLIIETID